MSQMSRNEQQLIRDVRAMASSMVERGQMTRRAFRNIRLSNTIAEDIFYRRSAANRVVSSQRARRHK